MNLLVILTNFGHRFLREALLVVIVVLSFAFIEAYAAPTKWLKVAAPQTSKVAPEETYLDRFKNSLASSIQNQLAAQMKSDAAEFRVELEALQIVPALVDLKHYRMQVLGLGAQGAKRLDGLIGVSVLVVGDNGTSFEYQVNGVLKVFGPVVIARTTLARGRLLDSADFEQKILPWKTLPTGAAGIGSSQFVGRRVKSLINAGDPVWEGHLEEALAIRQGDAVELTVFSGPGVIVRSRGVARQEGRIGELIRIEQPDTKKSLIATIVGDKSVEVRFQ